MEFPYNLAVLLLDIYPGELETYVHTNTCIQRLLFLFSRPVLSDSLRPHGLCSTPVLSVHHHFLKFAQAYVHCISDAIQPSHPLMTSSPQSFPASGTFPMSQLFASDDQNTGVSASASVLPMSTQGWFPLFDWFDLLTVQGTLRCLLQRHSLKASILWCSAFFTIQLH